MNLVWVLEQMNVVGMDDYSRIGIYAKPQDVLDELALVDLARDWSQRGDLRIGVDSERCMLWLEKGNDLRVQLAPERFGPSSPENNTVLTSGDLYALRRTMADLMHAVSDSRDRDNDANRPVGGSWKFVPDPMPEF